MIHAQINTKSYGDTTVLKDISFSVEPGETVAILGPSGIGKSTLLRLVAGIDTDFEGTITRPDRNAIVYQEPTLLPWRSTLENITLIHPDLGQEAAQSVLSKVGLSGKLDLFPRQLSLGQQRRLALARAFATPPKMLLLDEPFVSLDATTSDEMISLTKELLDNARPATVLVTHNEDEAAELATRTARLSGQPATLNEEGNPK